MSFKRYSRKHTQLVRNLRFKAREQNLDPAALRIYSSKKAANSPISKHFNAYRITDRQRFTLKAYGKPFNYQGVMTKRYDIPALLKLFFVHRDTLYRWMRKGYFPEPAIKLAKPAKVYWLYHQIQPVYVWYWHLRSRGMSMLNVTEQDYKLLLRMLLSQEKRWYQRLGIEYIDPYRRTAGKYGVIYLT